ncbi:MAG: Fic family protein [Nitrospinae bacterium]|nr:Fic family protein [Nitrospinota bacterium]
MSYEPPFTITPKITHLIGDIAETIGEMQQGKNLLDSPKLRKENRIKTITGTLAIEGNTLTEEQVSAVLEGKRVLGTVKELAEVRGAINAYEQLTTMSPNSVGDLLKAHQLMMGEIMNDAGQYRKKSVGIHKGKDVVHIAPQAKRVASLMKTLFEWMATSEHHPLIVSSVFHYEFEFIHPFTDGNGRMGRLWQTLILSRWKPLFYSLPLENLIYENQSEYYDALALADKKADSEVFIEFILQSIHTTLKRNLEENDQVGDQVSDQVKKLLLVMKDDWLSKNEIMGKLGLLHQPTFRKNYLKPALEKGFIVMKDPKSPKSPKQKYKRIS